MEISKTSEIIIKMDNRIDNVHTHESTGINENINSSEKKENPNEIDSIEDRIITFSDYTNYLLNYPIQNIFWNGNRNKINKDQLSRIKEVLKFIKFLKYDQDYSMVNIL